MTTGELIRQARVQAGFVSARAFADRLGISLVVLRGWESDRTDPTDDHIACMVSLLDCQPGDLGGELIEPPAKIRAASYMIQNDECLVTALRECGIPPELYETGEKWVAFVGLARATASFSADAITRLALTAHGTEERSD